MKTLLMYRFRIYPSRKQKVRLVNSLKTCKQIYNELLAISKDTYKFGKITLNMFDYNSYLSGMYNNILYAEAKQNISDRVHKAFQNFFRRVKDKSCKIKGFPRYKSRVMSITYPENGFRFVSNKHIKVSKIGSLPIILHRVPKGKIKTLTIKQTNTGKWFAIFACEMPEINAIHPNPHTKVGIDVGLENFATLSNGTSIPNPRYLIKSEARLKILHRRLSRKVKGSKNRLKAKSRLSKLYERIANQRLDFLHKLSRGLITKYSTIAVEDLKIKNMVRNHHLAKHISDASWSTFIRCLEYKAVTSGSKLVKVNPRNTSKTCSKCGTIAEMPLSKRQFSCPECNLLVHRDLNSAYNILVRADCPELNACGDSISTTEQSVANRIVEAGTIYGSSAKS